MPLEITIAGIFKTNVPTVDGGQVWIPLDRLQQMMMMPGEATLVVVKNTDKILAGNKRLEF